MRRNRRAVLFDVVKSASAVMEFTRGIDFEEYRTDLMRRSAVERQLEIIGEALNRLSHEQPAWAARIPDVSDVIGMRNMLIHGYDVVDQWVIWSTTQQDVPRLSAAVAMLVAELDEADDLDPAAE